MSNLLTLYNETNEVVCNAIRQAAEASGKPMADSEIAKQSKLWIRYEFEMAAQEFYQKQYEERTEGLTNNLTCLMALGLVFQSISAFAGKDNSGLLTATIGMIGLPLAPLFLTLPKEKTIEIMEAQINICKDANDFNFCAPNKVKPSTKTDLVQICDNATTALANGIAFPKRMQRRIQEAIAHYAAA